MSEMSDRAVWGLLLAQDNEMKRSTWDEGSPLANALVARKTLSVEGLGVVTLAHGENLDYPGYDYMDQGGKACVLVVRVEIDNEERFYNLNGEMDSYGNLNWYGCDRVVMRAVETVVYEFVKED